MKKRILLIVMIGMSFGVKAQDLTIGANNAILGDNGSGVFTQLIFWNGNNAYYGRNALGAGVNNQYFRTNGIDRMMINYNGNIGIGSTNPTSKLFIKQNFDNNNGGLSISDKSGRLIQIYGEGSAGRQVIRTSGTTNPLVFDLNGNERMRINENGSVGIGTTNPNGWKLAVNGNIIAKEIKVETGWSDFVFFDDYNLPNLQDVENHIKEKGHLKDIPSAKEVGNSIYKFLRDKLQLPINRAKSGIRRPSTFNLLGYGFVPTYKKNEKGKYQLVVKESKWKTFKSKLKYLTKKTTPVSFEERILRINQLVRGWINYFKLASIQSKLKKLEEWLRNRLRYCIWHHWKKPERKRKNLIRLGIDQNHAYAWSRTRMGGWAVAQSPILRTTITIKRLKMKGYVSLTEYYKR